MKAGIYPKSWNVVELRELITFITSGSRGWAKFYASEGALFLRIQNVKDGKLILNDVAYVNPPDSAEARRTLVREGDVLISITADLGRTAVIPRGLGSAYINQHLALIRLNQEHIDPNYLAKFLTSPHGQQQFTKLNREGVKAGLNFDNIKGLRIFLPPIAEQRRIAAILDRADAVRRKRQEAIALTEELLRSAFLEMFGDPVMNPKGWEMVDLGDCLTDIESGWSPECDSRGAEVEEWGVLKLGAVTYGHFDPNQNKALLPNTIPRPDLEVKEGDLLITRKNTYELVGASAYVYSTRSKLLIPDLIFRLCPKASIDPVYLWQVLSQKSTRTQLSKLASGTSGSMPNISKARLRTLLVPLPPIENQITYRNFVIHFWKQQQHQKSSSQVTNDLFNSLLQRAFRGEL